ncbi:MAG: extracellular solute-binding protein [Gammaproteobacteria bacterium]
MPRKAFLPAFTLATLLTHAPFGHAEPVHAVALHGTPHHSADFPHYEFVNPDAPKGGTVRLASLGAFDSLNGFILKGDPAPGIGMIYDSLTTHSPDEPFTEYGLLAETIDIADDRSSVTYTLRPEARWHDGKPVTADDVVFTLNILREKGHPHFRSYYASVEKAEALDARTVKFSFKPGDNRELALITGQLAVLPKHYWEGRDFTKTTLEPPLGSGPYRVEKLEAGRDISYVRVADYWGKDLAVNRGRFNFERIQYDVYRDTTVALEAFKAGDFDFRAENSSKAWATAYDIPAVRDGRVIKEEIADHSSQGMQGFVFNTRRARFSDRRVREAIGLAFDFEWSNKNLFYDAYARSVSFFSNTELAATGKPSDAELALLEPFRGQVPDSVFGEAYVPPVTRGDGRIRAQLRKATQLLKEAGWRIQNGKLVDSQGKPFEFELLLVSPLFERIGLPFKQNLQRLGITMNLRTVDTAQYIERIRGFDFDMVVSTFGQSLSPGNEQRNYWSSEAADTRGSRNLMGLKNPAVDALIEKIISANSREDLITACRALDRVLRAEHLLVPNWHTRVHRVAYWDKLKRPQRMPRYSLPLDIWWVETK